MSGFVLQVLGQAIGQPYPATCGTASLANKTASLWLAVCVGARRFERPTT